MSRQFTRAAIPDQYIAFAPAGVAGFDGGPLSVAFLWRADSSTPHGLVSARNAGGATVWGANPYSDGLVYFATAGFRSTVSWMPGRWHLTVLTKGDGPSVVRGHQYDYTAGTWTHADYGTAMGDSGAGPITDIRLGWCGSADRLDGQLAAAAVWDAVLTDAQTETMVASLGAWAALNPDALWALNQADTATPVADLTGGGADQSGIAGTSISGNEPPGWSYARSVALGAASLAAAGTATASARVVRRGAVTLAASATLTAGAGGAAGGPVQPVDPAYARTATTTAAAYAGTTTTAARGGTTTAGVRIR